MTQHRVDTGKPKGKAQGPCLPRTYISGGGGTIYKQTGNKPRKHQGEMSKTLNVYVGLVMGQCHLGVGGVFPTGRSF